ncbi:MAG: hypothetical protein ACRDGG_11060 [Anaerolineae bacterium]
MCFTFAGRIQTRLIALTGSLILACIFTAVSRDRTYLTMFALMATLAVALDIGVYSWLIGYQARWLTFVLGGFEFALLALMASQVADLGRMAAFYAPAWLLGWLTMEAALPLAWPRWAEDGGELHPIGRLPDQRTCLPDAVSERRRVFITAAAVLAISGLPWIAGALFAPQSHRFTGVLLWPEAHLPAIGQLLTAIRGETLLAADIHTGRGFLDEALWLTATLAWLVGIRRRAGPDQSLPWPIAALAAPLILPAPLIALLAVAVWLTPLLPWRWLAQSAMPKLALVALAIGIAAKALSGALPVYQALLMGVVVAWLSGVGEQTKRARGVLWLAAIAVSPLTLPASSVALLSVTAWPFVPPAWHWFVRSIVPAIALSVLLVWDAARAGTIDAMLLYQALWAGASFAWLIAVVVRARSERSVYWVAASAIVPMLLPLPIVALLAVTIWAVPALPQIRLARSLASALAAIALIVWGLAWSHAGAAHATASAPAYLDLNRWELAGWLRRSSTVGPVTPMRNEADRLAVTLGGRAIEPERDAARFWIAVEQFCDAPDVRFRQGRLCLIETGAQS